MARLDDVRAFPVLAGTLSHSHLPLRKGAVIGLIALGDQGHQGLLKAFEDQEREIQELALAVVVARDLYSTLKPGSPAFSPDLSCYALSALAPEIRYAAARVIELRSDRDRLESFAAELVGPVVPQKQSERKNWPSEEESKALLWSLVRMLASTRAEDRYRAAQVVALRGQPKAYWREIKLLPGPIQTDTVPMVPATGYESENRYGRDEGWMRRLLGEGRRYKLAERLRNRWTPEVTNVTPINPSSGEQEIVEKLSTGGNEEELNRLVFGTYVGLLRDTSSPGSDSKEAHRVRRDALTQIRGLFEQQAVDLESALAVYRRALHDPNYVVRKAALDALISAYGEPTQTNAKLEAYSLGLQAPGNVAKFALDALINMVVSEQTDVVVKRNAKTLAIDALNASLAEVRMYALTVLPKIYSAEETLELSILALQSLYPDVRFAVVDQLADSTDARVEGALVRALESDHEALCLKAANVLAARGDTRTVDVLARLIRSQDTSLVHQAEQAVLALGCPVNKNKLDAEHLDQRAKSAAAVLLSYLNHAEQDNIVVRQRVLGLLGRIGHRSADGAFLELIKDEQTQVVLKRAAFQSLLVMSLLPQMVEDPSTKSKAESKTKRKRYNEAQLLEYIKASIVSFDPDIRKACADVLADVDDQAAEGLLLSLVADRDELVRVAACTSLVTRVEHVEAASLEPLLKLSKQGKRELVLPVAEGLALRQNKESFIPLMLLLKAGLPEEKERALRALGALGDTRAVPDLLQMLSEEQIDAFDELVPFVLEALVRLLAVVDLEQRSDLEQLIDHHLLNGDFDSQKGILLGFRHAADTWSRVRLEKIASDSSMDDDIILYAISLLQELNSKESVPVLVLLLKDRRRRKRKAAQQALKEIHSDNLSLAYMPALDVVHTDIRLPAIQYLARFGDPETLLPRFEQIHNDEIRVQLRRGLARRKLESNRYTSILLQMLKSEAVLSRIEAAWLLSSMQIAEGDTQVFQTQMADALLEAILKASQPAQQSEDKSTQKLEARAWQAALWAFCNTSGVFVPEVFSDSQKTKVKNIYDMSCKALADAQLPEYLKVQVVEFVSEQRISKLLSAASDTDLALNAMLLGVKDTDRTTRAASMFAAARVDSAKLGQNLMNDVIMPDVAVASIDGLLPKQLEKLMQTPKTKPATLTHLLRDSDLQVLEAQLNKNQDLQKRKTAISILGRKGTDEAEALLLTVFEDESESVEVKKLAYAALKRSKRLRLKAEKSFDRQNVQQEMV